MKEKQNTETAVPEEATENISLITRLGLALSLDEQADTFTEVSQRILELTTGLTGDPSGYSSKKAFREDFKELRELSLAFKKALDRFRNNGLMMEHKDIMLDSIKPGNRPSLEALEEKHQKILVQMAKAKKAAGKDLSDDEAALLED
jgi:hypothetical protein